MAEAADSTTRSVLGMPEWIQTRWQARLAFLLVGAWTCSFACIGSIAVLFYGPGVLRDRALDLLSLVHVGFAFGLLTAPLLLMRTDVRRSVPLVWFATLVSAWLGLLAEERLGWDLALFASPMVGGLIAMLFARRLFGSPPRSAEVQP